MEPVQRAGSRDVDSSGRQKAKLATWCCSEASNTEEGGSGKSVHPISASAGRTGQCGDAPQWTGTCLCGKRFVTVSEPGRGWRDKGWIPPYLSYSLEEQEEEGSKLLQQTQEVPQAKGLTQAKPLSKEYLRALSASNLK